MPIAWNHTCTTMKAATVPAASATQTSATATKARATRNRAASPAAPNAAIAIPTRLTARGTGRMRSPRTRVSMTLAWISTPDIVPVDANGVGNTSWRTTLVGPMSTMASRKVSGRTSPPTTR